MKFMPFRGAIFALALLRKLIYPLAIAGAIWAIGRVSVAQAGFWSPEHYGLVMLAFAISALAVSTLRLGDGRHDPSKNKVYRRSGNDAAALWLIAFALSSTVVLTFTAMKRLPIYLACWPVAEQSPTSASTDTKALCAKLIGRP